ncbi:MAG: class F sortase [Dermatophilaceae bacterium]|nr:class F sortase [Intrasporangiaceae bacterium]
MVAATGAYLLLGDTIRAARYAAPAPAVVEQPSDDARIATSAIRPERIDLPAAGVSTIVEPAPATEELNAFTGEVVSTFPVPGGPFTTVWWEEGPRPGEDGLAVILGHTRAAGAAVFNDLPVIDAGAPLGVTGRTDAGDEVVARYVVSEVVTAIPKEDAVALRAVLDAPPPGATLALITCSGEVDAELDSREDNTVVFATLEGAYRR